jgi:hypothetical protein
MVHLQRDGDEGIVRIGEAVVVVYRRQAFLFGGFLLVLMNFSSPAGGMIDIPVTFFVKNRMHLEANELAVFKLWIGAPLFLGFVFGFIRDRWSPFGGGDQAHLMMFGVTTALIYGAMSLINPTYSVFLIGLFVATMAFRMVSSAAYGITNTIARKHAVSGQMSSVISIGGGVPDLLSFIGGGMLSQTLEGQGAGRGRPDPIPLRGRADDRDRRDGPGRTEVGVRGGAPRGFGDQYPSGP